MPQIFSLTGAAVSFSSKNTVLMRTVSFSDRVSVRAGLPPTNVFPNTKLYSSFCNRVKPANSLAERGVNVTSVSAVNVWCCCRANRAEGGFLLRNIHWFGMEGQSLPSRCKSPTVAQEHPTDVQRVRGEAVAISEVSRQVVFLGLQPFLFVDRGDGLVLFQDGRPSVLPTYRQEVSVPPRIVEVFLIRAASQNTAYQSPSGVDTRSACPALVTMSGRCGSNPVRCVRMGLPSVNSSQGPSGFFERKMTSGVPCARTSFGAHQVIIFADAVQVWALYPDRILLHMAARTYDFDWVAHHAVAFHVEIVEHDAAFAFVYMSAYRFVVIYDISASVLVEKERGVDASHFGQVNGFAPPFGRVFRLYEEISGPTLVVIM